MGSLTVSKKIVNKYFNYLKNLDNKAKKSLIIKLTKSIGTETKNQFGLESMYGAWEDDRDADEIISDIRKSRINKSHLESFE